MLFRSVDDIEKLHPATSNRIESYVFPTKHRLSNSDGSAPVSFEPLYFKFKDKLQNEVRPPPDHRGEGSNLMYTVYGNECKESIVYLTSFSLGPPPPVQNKNMLGFNNDLSFSPPVIDKRLLPPQLSSTISMSGMQYSPSSNHYLATEHHDYDDHLQEDGEETEDVIVIQIGRAHV